MRAVGKFTHCCWKLLRAGGNLKGELAWAGKYCVLVPYCMVGERMVTPRMEGLV